MPRLFAYILLVLAFPTWADNQGSAPVLIPIPEQPDIPPPVESGQPMQPDVTIRRRDNELIEEYRINNQLYMVKIKPNFGPEYYLIDTDGDGQMDARNTGIVTGANTMKIPQWVLLRW